MARSCLKTSQCIQKRDFDHKIFYHRFEIGDIVYRLNHATKIKQSTKLKAPWEGPYVVIKILSPVLIKIKNKKREFVVHHNNVQARSFRCVPLWIRRIRNSILSPDHPKYDSEVTQDTDFDDSLGLEHLFGKHFSGFDPYSSDSNSSGNEEKTDEFIPDLILPEQVTRTGRQSRKPRYFDDYTN